ncbi:MAG: hypothetical protein GY754_09425 [bacterium]|nr:hypothetical protein [bacterium]
MDDTKLADAITNLEIVGHKLALLEKSIQPEGEGKILLDDTIKMVRKTLDELRDDEVRREIESYSTLDDEESEKTE